MIVSRYTCRPAHDADLAGVPASIYACNEERDTYILVFDNGARLEIPVRELVRMKWDMLHSKRDGQ